MKLGRSLRHDRRIRAVLRRDLDRYAEHATVGYDAERGLERLTASLAVASAAGGAAIAAGGLKGLVAKVLTVPGLKVLAVCLVVGGVGTATVAAVRIAWGESRPVTPALVSLVSSAPSPAPVRSRVDVAVRPPAQAEPSVLPRIAPAAMQAEPTAAPRAAVAPRAERSAASRAPQSEPPAATRQAPLREQMAALVHLREVASSDPAAAVGLAAEYDARFGREDLYAEEREAIAVVALARSGRRDEARARGEAFLAAYPRSPFASRVRGALAP